MRRHSKQCCEGKALLKIAGAYAGAVLPWEEALAHGDGKSAIDAQLELQQAAPHHRALRFLVGEVRDFVCAVLNAAAAGHDRLHSLHRHWQRLAGDGR